MDFGRAWGKLIFFLLLGFLPALPAQEGSGKLFELMVQVLKFKVKVKFKVKIKFKFKVKLLTLDTVCSHLHIHT